MKSKKGGLAAGAVAGAMVLGAVAVPVGGLAAPAQAQDVDSLTEQARELAEEYGIDTERIQDIADQLGIDTQQLEELSDEYNLDPQRIEELSQQYEVDPEQIDQLSDQLGVDPQDLQDIDQLENIDQSDVEQAAEQVREQAQGLQEDPPDQEDAQGIFSRLADLIRSFF